MVVLGVDAHKRSHTVVAVDSNGMQLDKVCISATSAGHAELLTWSSQFCERLWAIEDCRPMSRLLERDLLAAGESGLRVPPKLMAIHRRSVRSRGKSDPIDALAVAQAALREPNLPVVKLDGIEREVRLLIDHRDDLVTMKTSLQNRIHMHLHELNPEYVVRVDTLKSLKELSSFLVTKSGVVVDIATDLVNKVTDLTRQVKDLERQIEQRTQQLCPELLELKGCAALTAGKLIGEVAGISRFKNQDAFARQNGTAPIPVWSANKTNHRLNRGGNRQINAAIHRIAVTQLRCHEPAKVYLQNQIANGKTRRSALRALKRKLSNEVYKRMLNDEQRRSEAPAAPQTIAA